MMFSNGFLGASVCVFKLEFEKLVPDMLISELVKPKFVQCVQK